MAKDDSQSSKTDSEETNSVPQGGIFSIFNALPEYDRGNRLYGIKRYEGAVECYQRAVAIKPDWARAWLRLAEC